MGDGASWIAEPVEKQFGAQGHYLVDFYHTGQYIGSAATTCAPASESVAWFEQQQAVLKIGQIQNVLKALTPHLENDEKSDNSTSPRAAYRYLPNRVEQLDYRVAQDQGLSLGSGKIASTHRYVIPERLKIAGAW